MVNTEVLSLKMDAGNVHTVKLTRDNPKRAILKDKHTAVIAAAPVTFRQRILLRLMIGLGLFALAILLNWLLNRQHAGYQPLFYLLLISIGYKILKVLFEWYHYWAVRNAAAPPVLTRNWTVDMFTTAMPGEPYSLIEDTLKAMVAVRYPHTTYLCDEGNDPQLKALCDSLGVRHMTREIKVDAKAGNINNALRTATGEICVILDPDHKPVPQLLDEVLPYFEDSHIGFVQSVQAYKNGGESFVARGAAEQTYTFYGPLMMGMSSYGTAQAIGANCVFRRAALDSIGGHAPGLSEDMHTAMRLHAEGWKSVYIPKILTRGLVPSNISAYYKQQLKWSRGTFELLLMVLPFLFGRLNWRQRLHYSFIPLHFAAGIIALIDIIIPLGALLTGEAPLLLEFSKAYLYLLPFFLMVLLVRQYAQRWLIEKKERGFHITGGVLLFDTWWVHLVGFVYTLLRIKVPYIPTPKEDECRNNLALSLPNFVTSAACIGILAYGIHLDSNPYNLLMAGYAAFNALLLLVAVWVGQDLWRRRLHMALASNKLTAALLHKTKNAASGITNGLFGLMRTRAPQLALLTTAVFVLLAWNEANRAEPSEVSAEKELGGFYLGIDLLGMNKQQGAAAQQLQQGLKQPVNVLALTEYWNEDSQRQLQDTLLAQIANRGSMPFINWLPVSNAPANSLAAGQGIMHAIANGKFDAYITQYAEKIRRFGFPLFINFAPESDNPAHPWHISRANTLKDYKDAVRHVQVMFLQAGVNNVSWVWNPWKAANMRLLYPGGGFVDWVGVSSIKPTDSLGKPVAFAQSFAPFHRNMKDVAKPVILTGFGLNNDPAYTQWVKKAISSFDDFDEIDGLILGETGLEPSFRNAKFALAANIHEEAPGLLAAALAGLPQLATFKKATTAKAAPPLHARRLQGGAGNFHIVGDDGQPFYIAGVAYNPEQSWRDGYHPLNRKKIDADFGAIKAMGANTIRRYAPSGYDRNILKAARKHGLKVMYGFWFDPKIDYARDKAKVAAYMQKVAKTIESYKNEPAILAWNIGNESSGLLKHHFAQPYLTVVRKAYIEMIEAMARKAHTIDPERPVLSSLEHARQLPGELYAFTNDAPSVDIVAVNSYYKEWISQVHGMVHRFRPEKPYMISEFGPKGYWEPQLNDQDRYEQLQEESDKAKAILYGREWQEDVLEHKGCNVGGVAFCWQDRYEGTATWFGLTDSKGRKKLAYDVLRQVWKKEPVAPLADVFINGPNFRLKPGGTYEFTAVCEDKSLKDFEWQLLSGNYLAAAGTIEKVSKKQKIKVTFPRNGKHFRLYVYATAGNNRVITASRAITLYDGIFNEGI